MHDCSVSNVLEISQALLCSKYLHWPCTSDVGQDIWSTADSGQSPMQEITKWSRKRPYILVYPENQLRSAQKLKIWISICCEKFRIAVQDDRTLLLHTVRFMALAWLGNSRAQLKCVHVCLHIGMVVTLHNITHQTIFFVYISGRDRQIIFSLLIYI